LDDPLLGENPLGALPPPDDFGLGAAEGVVGLGFGAADGVFGLGAGREGGALVAGLGAGLDTSRPALLPALPPAPERLFAPAPEPPPT